MPQELKAYHVFLEVYYRGQWGDTITRYRDFPVDAPTKQEAEQSALEYVKRDRGVTGAKVILSREW